MFKALLKKQLLELNQFYFANRKTGKQRSKKGTTGMMILFGIIILFLAGAVFALADAMFTPFHESGNDWLYFAIFSILGVVLGVFGSVFNTYSSLYLAKDNNLLLAMPIPPRMILLARMIGVALMSVLYSAIVWVPAMIRFWLQGSSLNVLKVIAPFGGFIVLIAIVTVLTCILGWVVAKASVKLKNKSFITVIISVVFIAIYYVVYFRIQEFIRIIVANQDQIVTALTGWGYPLYYCGRAASGELLPMVIVTVIAAGLFFLTYYVISRSFIKIVTTSSSASRKVYKAKSSVVRSLGKTLFFKELKRFTSSSVYMLNAGLGIVILVGLTIFGVIKSGELLPIANEFLAEAHLTGLLIPVVLMLICLSVGMDCITAPSISLEGNSLWILRSLPVKTWDILKAKERLHIVINAIPAVICGVIAGIFIHANVIEVILVVVVSVLFIWFMADMGLIMNLLKPNLTWKNESIAVKNSLAVLFTMLIAWGAALVCGGTWFVARFIMATWIYLLIWCVIFAVLVIIFRSWLRKRGTLIFEDL